LVVRVGHRRRPRQIRRIDIRRPQKQLDAFVGHRANRIELPRESSARRQRTEEQEVRNQSVVVRRLGGYSAAEQAGVGAELPLPRSFIAKSRIAEGDVVDETRTAGERKLGESDELRVSVENAGLTSGPP